MKKLSEVDSTLFNLCLDEGAINPDNPIPTIRNFNRWFDKSISLIVAT